MRKTQPAATSSVEEKGLRGFLDGFEGYYIASDDDRSKAYRNGLIVLDTNALLDLYRLTPKARVEMLSLLRVISKRLFVPHQVAAEFHRLRIDAVKGRRKEFEEQLQRAIGLDGEIRGIIRKVAQRAHGREGEADAVLERFAEAFSKGTEFIKNASETYDLVPSELAQLSTDPILDEITKILAGRVGQRPTDAELKMDRDEAEKRSKLKIPPGFKDRGKEENPAGDYLWWAEVLRFAKGKISHVLIVCNDVTKGDWTYDQHGYRVGPHPYLVEEMREQAGCRLLIATTPEFLEQAQNQVGASISAETVAEAASIQKDAESRQRRTNVRSKFLLEQLPEGRSANYFDTVVDMLRLIEEPLPYEEFIKAFQQRFPTITLHDEARRRARVIESLGLAIGVYGPESDVVSLTSAGRQLLLEQRIELLQQQLLERIRGARELLEYAPASESDVQAILNSGDFLENISFTQAGIQLRWLRGLHML